MQSRRRKRRTYTIIHPANRIFTSQWLAANHAAQPILRSVEVALAENRYSLQFTHFDGGREADAVRAIADGRVNCDGILLGSGMVNSEVATILRERNLAHVSYDFHAERFEVNTVRAHTADGIRQAVEHLVGLGHRRIGFIGSLKSYRFPLLAAAMITVGLPVDGMNHCIVDNLPPGADLSRYRAHVCAAARKWLDESHGMTAMIGSNDWFAQGMIDAMLVKGLRPGRDLSIIGGDNFEVRAEPTNKPMLTTIDNPFDLIGQRMADRLLNQIMHNQMQVSHESIPAPLIVRATTGPCPKSARHRR